MRIQTIHTNALGDVLNESSATGFRITDNQGRSVDMRVVDGMVTVRTAKGAVLIGVMDEPAKLLGKTPTGVIVDEFD